MHRIDAMNTRYNIFNSKMLIMIVVFKVNTNNQKCFAAVLHTYHFYIID